MKILVVAHYQGDGSPTAIFIHDQMKAFVEAGHEVVAITPIGIGKQDLDQRRFSGGLVKKTIDGIDHFFLRYLALSNFGEGWFNHNSAIMALKLHERQIFEGFQPDIIHAHTLGADSEIGFWLKRKMGCPLVVTTHGSDTFVPYGMGKKTALKRYADKADTVVCVSSLLRRTLEDCGVYTQMEVILNGFDISCRASETQKDPDSIVQVGYLVPRKKTDISIRALAMLREQGNSTHLTVIGSGTEMENLKKLRSDLHADEYISFTGKLPNKQVQERLAPATYFVMPSVREGFGIVYLEAMAANCIVIGTEGEGIADAIINGENGFLVPADDPEAIVRVIRSCMDDPQRAAVIAENGRKTAQGLTWPYNAAQYAALFEKLIEENKV